MNPCTHRRFHCTVFLRLGLTLALLVGFLPQSVHAATFTVTHAGDSGPGSLRQAILDASDADTITFASSLSGQTITLGSTLSVKATIDACGLPAPVTISGNNSIGVMRVNGGVTATLKCVVITRGIQPAATNGGGILNFGHLTLDGVTISDNAATNGGGIYNGGTLIVQNSTISGNQSEAAGGGVYNYSTGRITLTNSLISGNSASSFGAGIYNDGIEVVIENSMFFGNTTISQGGAIYNRAAKIMDITGSTIANNSSSWGGGITNNGVLTITNSTFSGNVSSGNGGGISNSSILTLQQSTFSGNSAAGFGGALYHGQGELRFTNTILANSPSGGDCFVSLPMTIFLNIRNMVESHSGCGTPFTSSDPMLGPLANYGGPTLTMALLPGSPAIDTGDPGACEPLDQRGISRPQGVACDIGAVEQSVPSVVTGLAQDLTTQGATLNGTVNGHNFPSNVTCAYGLTSAYGETMAASPSMVLGDASTPVSCTISGLEPGTTYHYRFEATNSIGTSYGQDQTFTTSPQPSYDVYLPLLVR